MGVEEGLCREARWRVSDVAELETNDLDFGVVRPDLIFAPASADPATTIDRLLDDCVPRLRAIA